MGSFSVWHWLVLLIYLLIFMVPAFRIVAKAGYSGWWSLLLLIPVVNLVMLWVFAFLRWPVQAEGSSPSTR